MLVTETTQNRSVATKVRQALFNAQRLAKSGSSLERRLFNEGKKSGLELAVPEMEMQIARVKSLTEQLRVSRTENEQLRRRIKELESQA